MMAEVEQIRKVTEPREVLLIVDAMTGQEAVNVAEAFHKQVPLTGLILTKVDGDARGGAALSIRAVTGVPDQVHGRGRKGVRSGALLPRSPGLAHPGHGRRAHAHRAS